MSVIIDVVGREILDSRGNPTVEVDVRLEDGAFGRAAVPSGASTGAHEAVELRDSDPGRYGGKGVRRAVETVNGAICDALTGLLATDQTRVDRTLIALDGTVNKGRLGANAILGASLATAKAAAQSLGTPLYRYVGGVSARTLPVPMMNIINGGAHADNPIDIQEFMVMPVGAETLSEAVRIGSEVFHALKKDLAKAGHNTAVGDEGGFAPEPLLDHRGARLHHEVDRGRRLQARQGRLPRARLRRDRVLQERRLRPRRRGEEALARGERRLPRRARRQLPDHLDRGRHVRGRLGGLEAADRPDRVEAASWSATTSSSPTPPASRRASSKGIANSILVKVNQIGSLTETLAAVEMAHRAGYTAVMSHRSGETEDATIADLAVATNCGQIKTGSLVALGPARQVQPAHPHRGRPRRRRDLRRAIDPQALMAAPPEGVRLYLVSPPSFEPDLPDRIARLLDGFDVACLRLALAAASEEAVARAADALRPVAHARDVPLVVADHFRLAKRLGLDGVHLSDGARQVRAARAELGRDAIVGAFARASRHDGLTAAEAGADYVSFGPAGATGLGDGSVAPTRPFRMVVGDDRGAGRRRGRHHPGGRRRARRDHRLRRPRRGDLVAAGRGRAGAAGDPVAAERLNGNRHHSPRGRLSAVARSLPRSRAPTNRLLGPSEIFLSALTVAGPALHGRFVATEKLRETYGNLHRPRSAAANSPRR